MEHGTKARPLFDPSIVRRAVGDSFRKLDPRQQAKNPVIFVVAAGAMLTTLILIADLIRGNAADLVLNLQIALWLWFTVLFANFAEAMAEGRGKAQAATLRKTRTQTTAQRVKADGTIETVPSSALREGDIVVNYDDVFGRYLIELSRLRDRLARVVHKGLRTQKKHPVLAYTGIGAQRFKLCTVELDAFLLFDAVESKKSEIVMIPVIFVARVAETGDDMRYRK